MAEATFRGASVPEIEINSRLGSWMTADRNKLFLRSSDLAEIHLSSDGLLGNNFSRFQIDTAIALVSGTVKFSALPVLRGSVITNLHFMVSIVSGTPTLIKAGLYNSSSVLLASSASVTTALDAIGLATFPLSSPYTVTGTTVLHSAIISVAGTAGTLGGTAAVTGKGTAFNNGIVLSGTWAGQTDMATPATIATATNPLWVGWS